MTNTAPEDALTRAMSVLSQNGDPLRPANSINHLIPAGVAGVLQKALSLNAADRPSSAAEMRQMLRESEKYAYLSDAPPIPAPTDANAFGQPTRLGAEATRADFVNQTDVKTEILPGFLSQSTSVKDPGTEHKTNVAHGVTSAAAPRKRRFGMAAAALLLLLAGGAAAGGLYLMNPALFGVSKAEKAGDPGTKVFRQLTRFLNKLRTRPRSRPVRLTVRQR